jgi:hypothetical protein
MKRAAAIVLSLMFVWLQAMSSAQVMSASGKPAHSCCSCKKACCVTQSAPRSQPLPMAPTTAGAQTDFSALVPMLVMWTLPVTAPSQISASAPPLALAVPLFTRHCARLI